MNIYTHKKRINNALFVSFWFEFEFFLNFWFIWSFFIYLLFFFFSLFFGFILLVWFVHTHPRSFVLGVHVGFEPSPSYLAITLLLHLAVLMMVEDARKASMLHTQTHEPQNYFTDDGKIPFHSLEFEIICILDELNFEPGLLVSWWLRLDRWRQQMF